jgi:hypothetical protein
VYGAWLSWHSLGQMNRILALVTMIAAGALAVVPTGGAAPITKQNGGTPVFKDFTSICAVPGYVNYGLCGGVATTFTNIRGKVNAVQPKTGRWNLGISFTGLQPGTALRLWGTQDSATPSPGVVNGFFQIGIGTADLNGSLNFSYQTSDPSNLGFDLNTLYGDVTLVTSYWSQQAIKVLNADGTLYVPNS